MIIANGCVVTLKDSAGNGTVSAAQMIGRATNGGTIKIESGTYTSESPNYLFWAGGKNETGHIEINDGTFDAAEGVAAAGKDSTIIVNGGDFIARDNAVLASNGSAGFEGATINVTGGKFVGKIKSPGYTGCGIYFPNAGELNVSGGEFEIDGVGICARAGKINVTGGSFKTTVTTAGGVGDKNTQIPANALYYDGAANYPGLSLGNEDNSYHYSGATFTHAEGFDGEAVVITQPTNGKTIVEF